MPISYKYNKITNKSIKGLILINKRDEHSILTIKELLDNNIISLEIIDKHVRLEFLNKGIEPIINYENRLHGVLAYYKTSPFINKKLGMTPQKWASYYKFCFT